MGQRPQWNFPRSLVTGRSFEVPGSRCTRPVKKLINSATPGMSLTALFLSCPSISLIYLERKLESNWWLQFSCPLFCYLTSAYPPSQEWQRTLRRAVCRGSWDLNEAVLGVASGNAEHAARSSGYKDLSCECNPQYSSETLMLIAIPRSPLFLRLLRLRLLTLSAQYIAHLIMNSVRNCLQTFRSLI